MEELGLFPLGIVLLPGEQIPLHIFEERYKELISECLDRGTEFGMVLADEDGTRSIGTTAAVVEVLERFDDGRSNILIQGRRRFRITGFTEGRSFATAMVEELADAEGVEGEGDHPTEAEVAECLRAYGRVLGAAGAEGESAPELDLTVESLAFEIAGRIEFGAEAKQELLEMRSERDRVIRLTELLEQAVDQVLLQRRARELAAGNGHVKPEDEG